MNNQAYKHQSGYDEYMTDINILVKKYEATAGLGAKVRRWKQQIMYICSNFTFYSTNAKTENNYI